MAPVPKPKRDRTKHYFREWREKAGLTQEQAIGRLEWSQSKLSRIESGVTPYNQDDLEAAAVAYSCSPSDLINVNPLKEGEVVDMLALLRSADSTTRDGILAMLRAMKTGTEGR